MRIVSYNILDGGEGRADPLAEVIEAQHPDVVILVEADNPDVIDRISRRLKMDAIAGQGKKHSIAILSRHTIVQSINHSALRGQPRCLLEVLLRDPAGQEWTLGAVHLHPGAFEDDEKKREAELAVLLEVFDRHRRQDRPHLLAGDFNSNAPLQKIDPAKLHHRSREAWEKNGAQIPRRVIQRLLDSGYLDTLHAVDPTAAQTLGTFTTQHPAQRIDYIFTWGLKPSHIRSARIEHDRLAKYASDHFPVITEIRA